jgi:hypothetical protein
MESAVNTTDNLKKLNTQLENLIIEIRPTEEESAFA